MPDALFAIAETVGVARLEVPTQRFIGLARRIGQQLEFADAPTHGLSVATETFQATY